MKLHHTIDGLLTNCTKKHQNRTKKYQAVHFKK